MSLTEYKPRHFSHEQRDGVTVVTVVDEKLSEEQNLEEFATELFAYVDQYDCLRLVLDCGSVVYASSSAIGKLITLHRKVTRVEGRFIMCSLQDAFAGILKTARLYDYFKTAETREDAIALLQDESNQA